MQHYADEPATPGARWAASPRRYAEMVAEDRALRLRGYEVYRFGGYELLESREPDRLFEDFVDVLAARHDRPGPTM
ncbi:MAG TPA: hypothetical protein VFW27_10375 [Actinoplanes sp.]|jgi:hypothetical protein|nr:hypothetical protein [Actinoplanes sp.]